MKPTRRRVILVQLPIPQPGLEPPRGNVPLAAGYLKLYARQQGLEAEYEIDILPTPLANLLGDTALVNEILARDPWMIGFSCYLWNINRTLSIASKLKRRHPTLKIVLGGPEITIDNAWVLGHPDIDYAVIGEGEQTFAELLDHYKQIPETEPESQSIAGLVATSTVRQLGVDPTESLGRWMPMFRKPLPNLNEVSSPYLAGILDAADEQMMMLETLRGCVFQCKFCYYPKSYDDLYFVSEDKIVANLKHAAERGAREVVLLDPTLNQRRNFSDFLRLLIRCNPERRFRYFGELRAEGINAEIAELMVQAGFDEVEIGLQSVDPLAMELMDRKNNMRAFERGVQALLDVGIKVKLDLIIGLPGDTVESIRRGMHYVKDSGKYSSVQVFSLAILPGTAFRQEASQLGLEFQSQPPYYVLRTPTLELSDLYQLLDEAEEIFETEFDSLLEPVLAENESHPQLPALRQSWIVDFDASENEHEFETQVDQLAQAFSLWFRGLYLHDHLANIVNIVDKFLTHEPHATLQIMLEPLADPELLNDAFFERIRYTCLKQTSYLDRFYSMQPGYWKGAKRIVVVLPADRRDTLKPEWIESLAEYASIVWRGEPAITQEILGPHEYQQRCAVETPVLETVYRETNHGS
ncbi:MAG: radical SAM protein [Planctomycetota bacterium]|nr:radical SAM protein [Planctomycetota bacterium]MDA1210936.1 radical SAM protein [Planctomycetota bacterium]